MRSSTQWIPAMALTGALLTAMLVWDPFSHAISAMNGAAPALEGAKVNNYFSDPATQEVSNGQHPLASLRLLETRWCGARTDPRYILSGNSQTMTVVLAPSEASSPGAAKTYPDILLDRLVSSGFRGHGYRLSAPNLSYVEVLWYLGYLVSHPCLTPNEYVLQLNFETFRKTGVRDGMLELLADPTCAAWAEQEARATAAPYSGALQQAVGRYKSMMGKQSGHGTAAAATSRTGLAESAGLGGIIETRTRELLDQMPAFKTRGVLKAELLNLLYLMRVDLLGITPATKRSLGGGTLTANVSALERVGKMCRDAGIRLVYFNAPQNPSAPLYRTSADREQYERMVAELARADAQAYFDFESSIPAPMWGVWVDGPDPIHFGREAHRRLADLMFDGNVIPRVR
jgi:hypothetical protein